jgi:serine protease
MKNNKLLAINAVAFAVLSATTNAADLKPAKQIEEVKQSKLINQLRPINQSAAMSFADWRDQQKLQRRDFTDRLIVTLKDDVELSSSSLATQNSKASTTMASLSKSAGSKLSYVNQLKSGQHILSIGKERNLKDIQKLIKTLQTNANVASVEPDHKRYFLAQNQPFGIANTQSDQVSDNDAANMTVCIIDSGYQRSHPDLNANNATGTNNSGTGNWFQAGGSHGTHVAGTIAGVNNSEGVVGVMPNTNVNLHIVKVFNASGWGYTGELIDAIDTCTDNGAKVVNMSLGGGGSSNAEANAMQAATDAGVLLIAASGNDGDSTLSYPASYNAVMAVGAVDENNQHAEFSQYTSQVEIAGPGEATLSTVDGDGRLGFINIGSTTYGNDNVAPQTRFVPSGGSYSVSHFNGSASGVLATCSRSGSSYSCSNVSGNICIAERNGNQVGSNYPEIDAAKACTDAGASGVIVYSNTQRPGLQNPFLVDAGNDITVPAVSVNRATGQQLLTQLGSSTTLTVNANQDYAYYNGTSMATPHVAGVAALVWSKNPDCSALEVRNALKTTALDLESPGRDDKTGFGLAQAKAATDYLAATCGSTTPPPPPPPTGDGVLQNGVAETGLSATTGASLDFTLEVPAGATDLTFDMAGGSGDADLYVKFGSAPTLSSYDCRPYRSGNSESCPITTAQAGTYYVKLVAYSSFSGVNLTGSFTDNSGGGGAVGGSASVSDVSVGRRAWQHYTIDIPAGMADLTVTMSGGSGDGDLYVRRGSQPTLSSYDCRPYVGGNNETCSFNNPTADTWHISVYGYTAASGITINVEYNP